MKKASNPNPAEKTFCVQCGREIINYGTTWNPEWFDMVNGEDCSASDDLDADFAPHIPKEDK